MRDALNIVRGAVSTKDLVPVLTHMAIHEGRLCGFDGRVYLSAPAHALKGLSFTVPADRFIAAVEGCGENIEPQFTVNEGRVEIAAGDFSAVLPTGPLEDFPVSERDAKRKRWQGALLPTLRSLLPFIGEDASRPWANGVLLMGARAVATNNVVIAEASLPGLVPAGVILPLFAVTELLRIGREPQSYALSETTLTLYFEGDVWLRTRLVAEPWPESAVNLVRTLHSGGKFTTVPSQLRAAVERVRPFCEDMRAPTVRFVEGSVTTTGSVISAKVKGFNHLGECAFRVEPLLTVLAVATEADWSAFPRVPWRGAGLSGVIVGLKLL